VVHYQRRSPGVVGVHPRNPSPGDPIGDSDEEPVPIGEGLQRRIAALDIADEGDPVGVGLLEHRAIDRRHVRPIVDMAQEQAIVAGACNGIQSAKNLDVEWVGDVPDDDSEERAAAAPQRAGHKVRPVAQPLGRRHDPLARLGADRDAGLASVEDPRDGGDGDAGGIRDVPQCGGSGTGFGLVHRPGFEGS
jgi:hypothetical protein